MQPDGNAINFITGAGGFLQTVISGYAGIRLTENNLSLSPACIEGSTQIKVRGLIYRGNKLDLEYWCKSEDPATAMYPTALQLTVFEQSASAQQLEMIIDASTSAPLTVGKTVVVSTQVPAAGQSLQTFIVQQSRRSEVLGNGRAVV